MEEREQLDKKLELLRHKNSFDAPPVGYISKLEDDVMAQIRGCDALVKKSQASVRIGYFDGLSAAVMEERAQPDAAGAQLLRDASETMRLSERGYHRVLRVARTLADLDGADRIGRLHLAEALSYRALAEDLRSAA